MADTLQLEIVTPERAVFKGVATEVVLPGGAGEIGVLPGHLPLLTSIAMGDLMVHGDKGTRHFFIEGGYAEILPHRVSVLAEYCDGADEIDIAEAREAVKIAEDAWAGIEEKARSEEVEADVRQRHQDALERARRRLLFADKDKG